MNAEALALASRFGLDLTKTLDVVHGTTATNGQLKINFAAKVPLPIAAAARESLSLARSTPHHVKDFSALLDHW